MQVCKRFARHDDNRRNVIISVYLRRFGLLYRRCFFFNSIISFGSNGKIKKKKNRAIAINWKNREAIGVIADGLKIIFS